MKGLFCKLDVGVTELLNVSECQWDVAALC